MEEVFWVIFAYVAGIVTVVVSVWILLMSEKDKCYGTKRKLDRPNLVDFKVPPLICKSLNDAESCKKRETCLSLNLIFQFFFQEKQYDKEIITWLSELISQELAELLRHRALSKIISKMEIQDLNLGQNFPVIKGITPVDVTFVDDSCLLGKMEFSVEIEYTGGFQLSIDAISKLDNKAVVKIQVVHLSGKGSLEFHRNPFTYWSFSFYEEPDVEFEVESTVLGRHIPRFKNIIISQLKNLITKKHTLPNFKLRGSPLVMKRTYPDEEIILPIKRDISDIPGTLFITLVKCTRLQPCLVGSSIYFSSTLSEMPIICAYETPVGIWMTQDIVISKTPSTPVGILLRTADDNSQIIETVGSKSPAYEAGLRKNDIVLSVNGIPLLTGLQAAKVFSSSSMFTTIKGGDGKDYQQMCIRIKRLIFTDHKRSSLDSKNLFETVSCKDDASLPQNFLSEPSVDGASVSLPSSFNNEKPKRTFEPITIQGDRVSFSLSNSLRLSSGDLHSAASTPDSSHSSSPDLKPKTLLNLSAPHPCDEDEVATPSRDFVPLHSSWEKLHVDSLHSSWEKPHGSSTPIQIPRSTDRPQLIDDPVKKQSHSAQSSRAGTPTSQTYEFVPLVVPPGMPILKMDVKSMAKKVSHRNRLVLKHFETSSIEGSCNPLLGNDFEFEIDEESKYVNICVWSAAEGDKLQSTATATTEIGDKVAVAKEVINKLRKKDAKEALKEADKRAPKDNPPTCSPMAMTGHPNHILVGYTNLSIEEIIQETALNSQGHVIKIENLQPADPGCPEVMEHPLLHQAGFDPKLCYGDVMLGITHQPRNSLTPQNHNKKGLSQPGSDEESSSDVTESDNNNDDLESCRDHDFKRTHFHSATNCNFCQKKIWLKDAYQCSECGIICHKKCMTLCEKATVCNLGGLRYREAKTPTKENANQDWDKDLPEIISSSFSVKSTEPPAPPAKSPQIHRHTLGTLLSHISSTSGALKRSGSSHNLTLPNLASEFGASQSLPPSPQASPTLKKKQMCASNPFLGEEEGTPMKHLENVMAQVLLNPHDERLVTLARGSAPQLYATLEPQERLERIKEELEDLQRRVDLEGQTRVTLAFEEREATERNHFVRRRDLAALICECDARTQALALLNLHYFTALQLTQEALRKVNKDESSS